MEILQNERRFTRAIYINVLNCGEDAGFLCGKLVPTCGYEFRGVKGAISVREFAKNLEEIESKRPTSRFGFKKVLENQNTGQRDGYEKNFFD